MLTLRDHVHCVSIDHFEGLVRVLDIYVRNLTFPHHHVFCVIVTGALLRNLCDDTHQIGEVGYYLSTFEATIVYIHELDLTNV